MAHLAGLHQRGQRVQLLGDAAVRAVLRRVQVQRAEERHVAVRPVDLVEVDDIGLQPLQAGVAGLRDLGRREVGAAVAHPVHVARGSGHLGRQHDALAHSGAAREPVADDGLGGAVGLAPRRHRVHLGRVDEVDAAGHGVVQQGMGFGLGHLFAKGHGAQANFRDFQAAAAHAGTGPQQVGEDFGDVVNFPLPDDMLDLIDMGIEVIDEINDLLADTLQEYIAKIGVPLSEVTLLAPIQKPRKNIIGIGLNYTEHVAESARTLDTTGKLPQKPIIFSKPPTTVTATNTQIIKNTKLTTQLDWEVELAVVIGKTGKYVPKTEAMDYVFGYTVINDISARDCRREGQWIVSKGQDTFAPMGPYLVTKDEIENPHNLNLSLKVNGVEKQNANTKFMLFNINDLIEDLSTVFTIEPGDIIATGTPSGVGAGRDPQEWLYEGDVIEATVEKIGTLVNKVKEI